MPVSESQLSANDSDVAFVSECCGASIPIEIIQRALKNTAGSVDRAVELILCAEPDAELARCLQEADERSASIARSAEESDRKLAESLALADREALKFRATGGDSWTGGKVCRRRRESTQWVPPPTTRTDEAPTTSQLSDKFSAEFELLGDACNPGELRDEQRKVKQRQIVAAKKATAAYRTKSHVASAHSVESGRLGAEYDALGAAAVSATMRQHNTAHTIVDRIDLHGLYVAEALNVMERYLDTHNTAASKWGRRYPVRTIVCVTGRGKNSPGAAKLRPALRSWLNARGFAYTELGEGSLQIKVFCAS